MMMALIMMGDQSDSYLRTKMRAITLPSSWIETNFWRKRGPRGRSLEYNPEFLERANLGGLVHGDLEQKKN